jgi:hypothetical protein
MISDLIEKHQDIICDYCELYIIQCRHSTSMFLCEGRFCTEAAEQWFETVPLGIKIMREEKLKRILK